MPGKKPQKKIELKQAAQEHLVISKLLQKKRRPEQKSAVEQIIQSSLPLADKIRQIEKIDLTADMAVRTRENTAARTCLDPEVATNRKRLKQQLKTNTLLPFLMSELPRMKKFGLKTHTLSVGFLPFSLRINRDVRKFFMEYVQKRYLVKLCRILNHVKETGWLVLTKQEFNLVIVFEQLCEVLYKLDFNLLNYRDRNLIDKLNRLETLFLVLYSRPEYIDLLIKALQQVLRAGGEPFRDEDLTVQVKRILDKNLTLPSLYNFLLGCNMFKYRRYLSLKDLLNARSGHLISTREFDCPDRVYSEINTYLKDAEQSLQPVVKRHAEIRKIKAFLPAQPEAEKNFELLEFFYNDKNRQPPRLFTADKQNVIELAIHTALRFGNLFNDLLCGFITLDGSGPVELFSGRFFGNELARLQSAREQLEKKSYSHACLSLQRFSDLKVIPRIGLSMEIEIMQAIDEINNEIVQIGMKLADLLPGRQQTIPGREHAEIRLEPEVLSGRRYTIPYEKRRMVSDNLLHSKTVLDGLSFVCCVCMLCGLFFKHKLVFDLIHSESRVKRRLQEQVEIIKRIAEPARFREIRQKYKI